jgi:hypothetical protein
MKNNIIKYLVMLMVVSNIAYAETTESTVSATVDNSVLEMTIDDETGEYINNTDPSFIYSTQTTTQVICINDTCSTMEVTTFTY